jgi:hypothetical protein
MSVNLIKDWQLSTEGDLPTANSLSLIAHFYGVDFENSVDLLGDIAVYFGYNHEDPNLFGVPYIQYISAKMGRDVPEGGSYLQAIVNSL